MVDLRQQIIYNRDRQGVQFVSQNSHAQPEMKPPLSTPRMNNADWKGPIMIEAPRPLNFIPFALSGVLSSGV